jgi:preprotein translocase subunit YajC
MIPSPIRTIVAGVTLVLLLVVILLGLSFCQARKDAQRAKAEGRVAEAQASAAQGSIEVQAGVTKDIQAIDAQTRENQQEIGNAANADQDAGEAGLRLNAALCRRVVYRDRPECRSQL